MQSNKKSILPQRYLPKKLTKKDRTKQIRMLNTSRKMYKKGYYYNRASLPSFQSKQSPHIIKAKKMYGVDKIAPTKELVEKTGCSKKSLEKITNKGKGAYYSSGSRPNQTAQSWASARLASAITSGKAGAIDYSILKKGCKKGSIGLQMANLSRKKYGYGHHKTKKVVISQ
jgi:DNA-binding Xre family transcriptional regulator